MKPPERYLHIERPGGNHIWQPFTTIEQLEASLHALAPQIPSDATWNCTAHTYPDRTK